MSCEIQATYVTLETPNRLVDGGDLMAQEILIEDGLYMAFDSDCGACKGISASVEEAAGRKVIAKPLKDPTILEVRRRIYGDDPPFKPTLIRARGGDLQAWTGPAIGAVLTREIGPRPTMTVIQALGVERQGEGRRFLRPKIEPGLSRRAFGQVAAGLAASISIFATGSLSSAALADDGKAAGTPVELSDAEAQDLFDEALSSEDVQGIVSAGVVDRLEGAEVQRRNGLEAPFRFAQTSSTGSTDVGDDQVIEGTGVLTVVDSKTLKDGTVQKAVGIAIDETHLLKYITEVSGGEEAAGAELYEIDPEHQTVTTLTLSSGGTVSEPVPEGAVTKASDPCGGCSNNSQLSPACKTSTPVACALGATSCVACAGACAATLVGKCVFCVATSCGGALLSCCAEEGHNICRPCTPLP